MDLLKREMQKKRKAAREDFVGRSFVRRSELDGKQLQKRRDEHPKPKPSAPASSSLDSAAASDPGSDPHAAAGNPTPCSHDEPSRLPRHEVIRRLRVLRQPVTLFGEVDAARAKRLELALKSSVMDGIDGLIGMTRGQPQQANDFLTGDVIETRKRRRSARDACARRAGGGAAGGGSADDAGSGDDDDAGADKDLERMEAEFDVLCVEDKILVFFKRLLNEWKQELDGMSEREKRTANGKRMVDRFRFNQSAQYLAPLFEFCRKKILPDDIRQALLDIVECCIGHDYLLAMQKYIKLAIGNKPWPIGVTMVGIHERSAREKISTNSVAHIMNDETTRRYLQSIKRLMTLCEPRHLTLP